MGVTFFTNLLASILHIGMKRKFTEDTETRKEKLYATECDGVRQHIQALVVLINDWDQGNRVREAYTRMNESGLRRANHIYTVYI